MPAPLLYCGDTSLAGAAAYLAGLLTHWEFPFEYIPSHQPLTPDDLRSTRPLYIFSDYPAANASEALQQGIAADVAAGAGLLMIGGWESFHGLGGNWDATPLAGILPVAISDKDDRVNCDQPCLVRATGEHESIAGLPWGTRPPGIGGLNRWQPKPAGRTVLVADRCTVERAGEGWTLAVQETHPLLVVGKHGQGSVAALATDVAPHWVGGLVDWGADRVTARAHHAEGIEVGDLYARFLQQLVSWVLRPVP